jgi:hypothetical protein
VFSPGIWWIGSTIAYRGSAGPLHLLIDSIGIMAEGEGDWHARKHGGATAIVQPQRDLEPSR